MGQGIDAACQTCKKHYDLGYGGGSWHEQSKEAARQYLPCFKENHDAFFYSSDYVSHREGNDHMWLDGCGWVNDEIFIENGALFEDVVLQDDPEYCKVFNEVNQREKEDSGR